MVESSARGLGVRLGVDVHPNSDGEVSPGEGMSVAPDDPFLLDTHRRPKEFGGDGRDPLWVIDEAQLVEDLEFWEVVPLGVDFRGVVLDG